MSEDLSNKTLAILLGISIVVSLGGLAVFLASGPNYVTGAATSPEAQAQVEISSKASINWTQHTVNWGTGNVQDNIDYCMLNTRGANDAANCTGFSTVTEGLRLINDGNRYVSVNLSTNNSAAEFLGGTAPLYQWMLEENETNACLNATGGLTGTRLQDTSWTNVDSTADGKEICPYLDKADGADELNVELKIIIPQDSYIGVRESTITATATTI